MMRLSSIALNFLSYSVGPITSQHENLRILMYHRIQSHPKGRSYLSPAWFTEHTAFLRDSGYVTYTLRYIQENWPDVLDGPKAVVLTFDDAWASHVDTVLPVLKQYGFFGTFFVPTAHIREYRHKPIFSDLARFDAELCSWKDIQSLDAENMEIGGHTHTHCLLGELSTEEIWDEFNTCRRILEDHVRKPVVSFSYPFGKLNAFNADVVEMVAEQGYKVACTTIWGCPTRKSHLLMLPRIDINGCDTLKNFKRKIKGRFDFLRWVHACR